jgi:hypothetical protein
MFVSQKCELQASQFRVPFVEILMAICQSLCIGSSVSCLKSPTMTHSYDGGGKYELKSVSHFFSCNKYPLPRYSQIALAVCQ